MKQEMPPQSAIDALISLLQQGRFEQVEQKARTMLEEFPDLPVLHNIHGAAQAARGRLDEATSSYRKALQINPGYAEAHNNLAIALQQLGHTQQAIAHLAKALALKPGHADAHYNLGMAYTEQGRFDEALASFNRALECGADRSDTCTNLGNLLRELGRPDEAMACYVEAIEARPMNADAHRNLGVVLLSLNRVDEAIAHYSRALQIEPGDCEAHFRLGVALRDSGRLEEAIKMYSRALELDPDHAEAHQHLSALKRFRVGDEQLAKMEVLVKSDRLSDKERMQLGFALGKAYDDLGSVEAAFHCFSEANRLRRQSMRFDLDAEREKFDRMRAAFDGEVPRIESATDGDGARPLPVFIVGMPRSGSTLVEQILASHSQVHGAGELDVLARAVGEAGRPSSGIEPAQLEMVRKSYLGELSGLEVRQPFITDKMLDNFLLLGFIFTALPEARVIHTMRDARAICWSAFKHYFGGTGYGYSYSLEDLVAYYRLYSDLMAFWERRFPGRIYHLNYQSLTENQESETRRLLANIGLPWEAACLDFHTRHRAVKTASELQVRQKLYRGSSEMWRQYEPYLAAHFEGLAGYGSGPR